MGAKAIRTVDHLDYHAVTIALSRARAMASVLEQLGEEPSNNLVAALRDGTHPPETREWLQSVVGAALRVAIDEAEAAFRKSLTPTQAKEQVA
jgi:hypothetical protein